MTTTTAAVSRTVDAPAASVWAALIDPAKLKTFFFGADVKSDWKVGSPITMKGEYQGKAYEDKGEILVVQPQKRLSFTHWSAMSGAPDTPDNYHVVTFDLTPEGTHTQVVLSQANLNGGVTPSDVEHRADYEKNWRTVLDGLANVVKERPGAVGAARN